LCKNCLSVKTVVHIFLCVKVSVRISFCSVKTVLGKVSECKKSVCKTSVCSLCTSFSVSHVFLCRKNMCKKCSVQRLLCGICSVRKNAYVPLSMRAKTSLYKASVCKYFLLCVKTSVCKGVCVQKFFLYKHLCAKISARKRCKNCSV